jgi:diguanylate cyclase (GGDEF)-like protein
LHSIRFGVLAIAVCGIAALATGLQVAVWVRQVGEMSMAQEAANDQIVELRNVMDAILDLETGQRGYLLAGQEAYLEPYNNGRKNLEPALAALTDLFTHGPATRDAINEIVDLVRAKEKVAAHAVELRQAGGLDLALASIKTGEGKRLMDEFRQKADQLLAQLRQERSHLAKQIHSKFRQVAILGAAVILLILLVVTVAVRWLSLSVRHLDELQKAREQEAMHDALTALPNRRFLGDWLNMALAAARRAGRAVVLLYFDLDGFKAVNDRLGHQAGDRVLQATAARLRDAVRSSDFVARLGGDEFVAVLLDAPAEPELSGLLARVSEDLAKAPIPELRDGDVSASIGLARYPGDGDSADALLSAADRAMYLVKERRRSTAALASLPALVAGEAATG